MSEKSKFIAFRCPRELYERVLKKEKDKMSGNMSKFIKGAIKIYKGKEFHNNIHNAFIQYSKLFHLIEKHFNNRTTLGINDFINLIQSSITNTEAIDKTEEIIKNGH